MSDMAAGRELDVRIAEDVMGIAHVCRCQISDFTDDGCNTCGGAYREEYSVDIASAWLVVEKLRLMVVPVTSHEWERDPWDEQGDLPRGWAASQCSASERRDTYFEVPTRYWSFAPTASLAICRAALKSIQETT